MFGISFAATISIGIMAGVSSTIIVVAAIIVSGREEEYEELVVSGREEEYEERRELEIQAESSWG